MGNTQSDPSEPDRSLISTGTASAIRMSASVKCTRKDEDVYPMTHRCMGVCVIINNRHFKKETERVGTDIDARRLDQLFTKLGFDVRRENNKTTAQMDDILKRVAREDHTNNNCFVCVILSHGDLGVVCGTDGVIKLDILVEHIAGSNCESLVGKPKVFIIQACRGNKTDTGVNVMQADGAQPDLRIMPVHSIPQQADFLYAYSTVPGYLSWRDSVHGSWFIQSLFTVFWDTDHKEHDILTLLTKVNGRVAICFEKHHNNIKDPKEKEQEKVHNKQMPSIVSMLTRKLYLIKRQ